MTTVYSIDFSDDNKVIELEFTTETKRNFLIVSSLIIALFSWGFFFIDDLGWSLIGLFVLVVLILVYRFVLCKQVVLSEETISQVPSFSEMSWPWSECDEILIFKSKPPGFDDPVYKVNISHQSGREIVIDYRMTNFSEAFSRLKEMAKIHSISVVVKR